MRELEEVAGVVTYDVPEAMERHFSKLGDGFYVVGLKSFCCYFADTPDFIYR